MADADLLELMNVRVVTATDFFQSAEREIIRSLARTTKNKAGLLTGLLRIGFS